MKSLFWRCMCICLSMIAVETRTRGRKNSRSNFRVTGNLDYQQAPNMNRQISMGVPQTYQPMPFQYQQMQPQYQPMQPQYMQPVPQYPQMIVGPQQFSNQLRGNRRKMMPKKGKREVKQIRENIDPYNRDRQFYPNQDQLANNRKSSRRTWLNTTLTVQSPVNQNFQPDPNNPDTYTQQAINERAGPVDYYPHWSFFPRWYSQRGFNNWFQNLWWQGRWNHEYRYDLIDTNFFLGEPNTVGNPVFSDQEAVDFQNYEQHFQHLQKILADERTDQDFVIEYSKEKSAHDRMLRFRNNRDTIFQSILQMERIIYAEQDLIIVQARNRTMQAENETMTNITTALQSLVDKPFFPKFPDRLDIFTS